MNIKRDFTIILVLVAITWGYVFLNKNYMEGVNACVEKGFDVDYCEYHASK